MCANSRRHSKCKLPYFSRRGAFAAAMDVLNKKGMAEALCTYIENDRPF
ncbi:hypothetical protein CK203_021539 [Vitis vinifera]|uniref:Uncharacterized protein n=1 Tax=Vitis vinifera TaxID=29760 RepID=A0A438ISL8_VITVI|nr:hypothetical protein CK203_021539 [Vitis vinifera]